MVGLPHRRSARSLDVTSLGSALVCFSHLRWSFVWQRPQHVLSRFAESRPVYVVEEPEVLNNLSHARLDINRDGNVTILRPMLPASDSPRFGFNDATNPWIAELLAPFFEQHGLLGAGSRVTCWYYTPMALGAEPRGFQSHCVVYDVMDELANFRGAPASIRQREQRLFELADIVFTGGPSLYQSRQGRHPSLHCFPSGVDIKHFAQARESLKTPGDIAGISGNVVGFYGVLDERLDLELIGSIADLRPNWNVVMIGPVVKISESDLPRRPNIHYLGKRDYRELPAYLARFDAAILPFARNEATRFISPTKTLEYLAAGKHVVSTSIKDVVDLYGSVVAFGDEPETFVSAIEQLWAQTAAERRSRRIRARRLLAEHEWEVIAQRMRLLVDETTGRDRSKSRAPIQVLWPPVAQEALSAGHSD
jgi:UDP-galactopyranose mutase